ncbi:CxxH/CxxC protein [Paenibacillus sp. MBLB4367]|uniref:CxxH/CxxC protein n=1 Tax=Paenibacillus sp. MBLB4367 TaxID=3384767 RepID=UPI00390825C6
MFVVCKDHLELAIDRFVDEYEDAPDLIDLQETRFAEWAPPSCCEEHGCDQLGRFLVV